MKFGPIPVANAAGAILAHATTAGETRLRKAHRLTARDVEVLEKAGISEIIAAVLDTGDLDENEAATRLAQALKTSNASARPASTGRVNFHAEAAGVFTVDKALIDALNAIDPSITIATLADHATVEQGQMVATVKIIPFAVAGALVDQAAALSAARTAFAVHRFSAWRVGLVQTTLPGIKHSVLDKTARTTAARLERSGSSIAGERRVAHQAAAVAVAIEAALSDSDMILVFGASAVSDPDDVIPAAIRLAGGTVARTGMPVDPGNLLVLGDVGGTPVIGAPGCARSPKVNGFDWVLDRVLAGLTVSAADIAGMGVGGLLMEIPTRPQPREGRTPSRRIEVAAVLLAAGRSSRMGPQNKLLADFEGVPLVRRVAQRLAESGASATVAVVGHQAERVRDALAGLALSVVDNLGYADGLSTSLKAGVAALPASADGAMIVLGDMPGISTTDLDALIAAFAKAGGGAVVRATHGGKRGNPVILPRALFAEVEKLEGDTGARHIVEASDTEVIDVEIGEAASVDVDTPDAMREAGGVLVD